VSETADILCFLCGAKLQDPPEIPELEDGSECPACRDRLLDSLPPLLPRRGPHVQASDTESDSHAPDEL
jgi:hypothetical protein